MRWSGCLGNQAHLINNYYSSKGSIVAEFELMFRKNVPAEEAYAELKKKIGDGNLGSLRVDPASLDQISRGMQGNYTP